MQNDQAILDSNHVEYREINLDEQPEYIKHVKNLGFSAAPVIQTPDEVFSGFQPAKWKALNKHSIFLNRSSVSLTLDFYLERGTFLFFFN